MFILNTMKLHMHLFLSLVIIMIIFIDEIKKICFLVSPKSGTTTIANYLNINIHIKYSNDFINNVLTDDTYLKLIIIRKNIIDRFISGFYEDLFNNTCYNNMDITFNNYLLFLNNCYINKITNVNNLNSFLNIDVPVWFGNCSNRTLPITNKNGLFCSHIMSQHYALNNCINQIKGINVKLIELNNLNTFLKYDKILNKKEKTNIELLLEYNNQSFILSDMCLYKIKETKLIISENNLTEEQKKIILNIYMIDINFIKELETQFEYILCSA